MTKWSADSSANFVHAKIRLRSSEIEFKRELHCPRDPFARS